MLVPLEQQAIALSAADQLVMAAAPTEGELGQAAALYVVAGHQHQAATQLIRAARLAVAHAALDAAQQYLAEARALTGELGPAAREVLIERIETLTVAGRAADAYESGIEAMQKIDAPDGRSLVIATAQRTRRDTTIPRRASSPGSNAKASRSTAISPCCVPRTRS